MSFLKVTSRGCTYTAAVHINPSSGMTARYGRRAREPREERDRDRGHPSGRRGIRGRKREMATRTEREGEREKEKERERERERERE